MPLRYERGRGPGAGVAERQRRSVGSGPVGPVGSVGSVDRRPAEGDAAAQEEDARVGGEAVAGVGADDGVDDLDLAGAVVADEEDGAAAFTVGAVVGDLGALDPERHAGCRRCRWRRRCRRRACRPWAGWRRVPTGPVVAEEAVEDGPGDADAGDGSAVGAGVAPLAPQSPKVLLTT